MKNLLFAYLTLAAMVISCSTEEPAPSTPPNQQPTTATKSSEKQILTFSFASLTPAANGIIDQAGKKIAVLVPKETDLTALAPTVTISGKASVTPASGVAQNFTSPVTYEVTAEDGTKETYTVTATVDQAIILDTFIGSTDVEQASYFLIKGNNFGIDATKVKVTLINKTTSATTDVTTFVVVNNTSVGFFIPETIPTGTYSIKLTIGSSEKTLPETFTISVASPQIQLVDKTTLERGQNLVITGKFFAATGNVVKLKKNLNSKTLDIVTQSPTSIEVTVPLNTDADTYSLSVTSNGKESFYSSSIVVTLPSTAPIITNIDKTSYALGETMIITGQNLKKTGAISNINFIPFTSGTTQVRSGIPNTDGTELSFTIPLSGFATGTYIIIVEVDFVSSEEYVDVIQITN